MNEHPDELLAGYVERSLDPDERARVESHLATCDRCREEVELASEAHGALTSLPELEPPAGIPLAVRREMRREPRRAPSRLPRIAGIAAAAAVLAAGAIFVFSKIDLGPQGEAATEAGGGERPAADSGATAPMPQGGEAESQDAAGVSETAELSAAPPPVLPIYRETERDYKPAGLAPLARQLRDEARGALAVGLEPTARAFFDDFEPAAFTVEVRQAIRCVLAEVPPEQLIVPYRIEAASFQGTPAYIAAFLEGPTPDDPYDRIVIWVVDREECSLLSLASQVL